MVLFLLHFDFGSFMILLSQRALDTVGRFLYLNLIHLILHFQDSLWRVQPPVGCVDLAE